MRRLVPFALLVALVTTACRSGPATPPRPSGPRLSTTALKVRILHAFGGQLSYCDPDFYPVAIDDPLTNALRNVPGIRRDEPTVYRAIASFEHFPIRGALTEGQTLQVWNDYKQIQVIQLHRVAGGFRFLIQVSVSDQGSVVEASGAVNHTGQVVVDHHESIPADRLNCPICLARGTLIARPGGPVAVQDVRVGMAVWTTDRHGRRVRATVLRVGRTPVPPTHEVVRLALTNGHTVLASPEHPTPDGRLIGDLRAGDTLDGSRVTSAVLIPYAGRFTYDLLPSGPTRTYFANGILLGSTLASR